MMVVMIVIQVKENDGPIRFNVAGWISGHRRANNRNNGISMSARCISLMVGTSMSLVHGTYGMNCNGNATIHGVVAG